MTPIGSGRRHAAPFVRFFAFLLFLGTALTGVTWQRAAGADGVRIHVHGSGRLTAHAARDQGDLVFSGSLVDDAGEPLPNEQVQIQISRESDPHDPAVAEGLRAARGCERTAERTPGTHGIRLGGPTDSPDVTVVTDEGGRFCFRAKLPQDRHRAHLAWKGAKLVEGANAELSFDLSREALVLRFDPKPHLVSLDLPQNVFEVSAQVEDNGALRAKSGIDLTLANELGEKLGVSATDATGRARFTIDATKLGPPGLGELRVSFAGDTPTAFATEAADIERRVNVSMHVPTAERGELTPRVPDDGIPIVVETTSAIGPISSGAVEARVGDVVVGAAPVERGVARLVLTFAAQGNEALVRLKYVPSAPWFASAGDATLRLPIRAQSIVAKAPLFLAGLAVLAFFLVGRVASKSGKPTPRAERAREGEIVEAKPHIEVVRAAARGETGWRGKVVDAHEGFVVPNATIWIERGTFEGTTTLASTMSNAEGAFEFQLDGPHVGGERIVAEAPLHARLTQGLPAPGELAIALVLRRRALLARLVAWAKRVGPPFDIRPEATPGHVKQAASDDLQTARWAEAVERAAYAGSTIDAATEAEIDALAPQKGPPKPAAPAPQTTDGQDDD
ncbi:hypothetical protein AKJ09_06635 [Labilithrix luteola]|uniref:Uncharacterized protein n=1 Tax=Labilithrix luteola TaxID=1391654 RepID=A0A0K1Q2V0_9BACT|nr:carboxypeptidase-like regulatory domain-containing protein [Labilithrix luteola]AKU99971.1 hypothetical protein AKJ09_06635 [Labilithrix luteola]